MDPTIAMAFAQMTQANAAEQAQAVARQRDGAAEDMRGIGAGVFRLIAQASDPSTYADLQTSSHVPTPQPYVVPNFITPNGNVVGAGS